MPRPNGRFTYDPVLDRFRNAGGQLIPDTVILPTAAVRTVSSDDALEMRHTGTSGTQEHVAGASTPEWLGQMRQGLKQPCVTCGEMVGLKDVLLDSTHSRDWGKAL